MLKKINTKFKRIAQKTKNEYNNKASKNIHFNRLQELVGESANCPSTSNDPREKLFIYDEVCSHIETGYCLEVGSYLGSSSIMIAEALKRNEKGEKLFCIDTWQNDAMSEGKRDTFDTFQQNIKPWCDLITPIRGKSQEVEIQTSVLYDVVFIDADHSYEGCKADVRKFSPLVREGGCLMLDDHISFPGVTRVVGELLTSGVWYVGASYVNLIALYKDEKSLNKERRKRVGNKSI